jgi:3D (Asp-Asp-Asp) domain-containing protein
MSLIRKLIILIEIIIIILLLYALPKAEAEPKYFILEATGYYPEPECCWPDDDGFTAIGDVAGRGSVAIDDKSGPLRMDQRVWVEGYGYGKCNDRGSAIKGWKIDLCFETLEEAKEWGRKLIKVYILEGE